MLFNPATTAAAHGYLPWGHLTLRQGGKHTHPRPIHATSAIATASGSDMVPTFASVAAVIECPGKQSEQADVPKLKPFRLTLHLSL